MDAEEGWQYAQSFDAADDEWVAEQPPPLQRLLKGSGAVAAGLGGGSSSRSNSSSGSRAGSQLWVRRRRWVRVMRRRLDIPPLPFMQPDGNMYHLDADGALIPYHGDADDEHDGSEGQELGVMPSSGLTAAQDYVGRARYLAGTSQETESSTESQSSVEARRAIAKLERATAELRQGILGAKDIWITGPEAHSIFMAGDSDIDRKTQAEVLLNAYSRELERRRLAAGAQGLLISGEGQV